jgi:hypothetical protein
MTEAERIKFSIIDQRYSKGLRARLLRDLQKLSSKELIEHGCAAANASLLTNSCTKCSRSVAEYLLRWQSYSDEKILKLFPSKIAYLVNSTCFVRAVKSGHKRWSPITTNKQKVGV